MYLNSNKKRLEISNDFQLLNSNNGQLKETGGSEESSKNDFSRIIRYYFGDAVIDIQEDFLKSFPEFKLLGNLPDNTYSHFSGRNVSFLQFGTIQVPIENYKFDNDAFDKFKKSLKKFKNSQETTAKRYQTFFSELDKILPNANFDSYQKKAISYALKHFLCDEKSGYSHLFSKNDTDATRIGALAAIFKCPNLLKLFSGFNHFDIDFKTADKNKSLIHIVVENDDLDCLQVLITARKKLNKGMDETKDEEGNTPFLLACKKGKPEIIKALVYAGSKTDVVNATNQAWPEVMLSNSNNTECFKQIIELELLDIIDCRITEDCAGIFGLIAGDKNSRELKNFLLNYLPEDQCLISQWANGVHFLSHILNISSSNYIGNIKSLLEGYLRVYAKETKSDIPLKLSQMLTSNKWKDLTPNKSKLKTEMTLFFNDYPGHIGGSLGIITPHKQILLNCNGGSDCIVVYNIKSKITTFGSFHWDHKYIGVESSGITVHKIKNETSESFKKKIEDVVYNSKPIENVVRMLFKTQLSVETQEVGNCAYFNTMLTLKTAWGIFGLIEKGKPFSNKDEYYELLAKEIQEYGNYKKFEDWMAEKVYIGTMEYLKKIDLKKLKESYPKVYDNKMKALGMSLFVMLSKGIKNEKKIKNILSITPEAVIKLLMEIKIDEDNTLCSKLSDKLSAKEIAFLNDHLPSECIIPISYVKIHTLYEE